MTPTFQPDVLGYTVETGDATNTITAVPAKTGAKVEISNGDTTVANGGTAAWTEGENTLTIRVEYGTTVQTYTVAVTYTKAE